MDIQSKYKLHYSSPKDQQDCTKLTVSSGATSQATRNTHSLLSIILLNLLLCPLPCLAVDSTLSATIKPS